MNFEEEEEYNNVYSYIEKGETLLNDNKNDDALNLLNKVIECSQFESLSNSLKYEAYFSQIVHRSHDLDVRRGGLLLHPIAATISRCNGQK